MACTCMAICTGVTSLLQHESVNNFILGCNNEASIIPHDVILQALFPYQRSFIILVI